MAIQRPIPLKYCGAYRMIELKPSLVYAYVTVGYMLSGMTAVAVDLM